MIPEAEYTLYSVLIIAEENRVITELRSGLIQKGFACSIVSDKEKKITQLTEKPPDLVLVEIDNPKMKTLFPRIKREKNLLINL